MNRVRSVFFLLGVAAALGLAHPADLCGDDAKPDKVKLPDDVEKAFGDFTKAALEARRPLAKADLGKLCDELAKSVKLTPEQRKQLETEAQPAVEESCAKFSEALDKWLRPFLAGYGNRALTNLSRWKAEQFATRPNVITSPQDAPASSAAIKRVLNAEQLGVYEREMGDKTARRKKEIVNYLKEALLSHRDKLGEMFRLEREGVVRELGLEKARADKLEAGTKQAVDEIVAEDEKSATEQFLAMTDESWRQMSASGGTHQFDANNSNGNQTPPNRRSAWLKALGTVLSPEELQRWEGSLARRQERREHAAKMGAVAEMEERVLLSPEQRTKLEAVFLERWKRYPQNDNQQIYPMNLMRSGPDADVRSVLSPAQQKRWDEAFNNGGQGGRQNDEDKGAPALQPEDTERILSTELVETFHEQRARLLSAMQERVEEIVRVTGLTGRPLEMLRLAAAGAVERVLEGNWKGNVESNLRRSVDGVPVNLIRQRLDSMGSTRFNTEPPEEHALWTSALKNFLTPEQQAACDKVLAARRAYRDEAVVHLTIAQLETTLRLSAEQAEALEPHLAAVVRDYWPDYRRTFGSSSYAIYPYYLPVMLSGLPEKERKAILTPEQLKQFEGEAQNRYNGWWDSMKRHHETRMKGGKSADGGMVEGVLMFDQ